MPKERSRQLLATSLGLGECLNAKCLWVFYFIW